MYRDTLKGHIESMLITAKRSLDKAHDRLISQPNDGTVTLDELYASMEQARGEMWAYTDTLDILKKHKVYVPETRKANRLDKILRLCRSERDETIVRQLYGIYPFKRTHTMREIAEIHGISSSRVRQIKETTLRELRMFKIDFDYWLVREFKWGSFYEGREEQVRANEED